MGYNSFLTLLPLGMRMIWDEDIDIELEGYPETVKKYYTFFKF